MVEGPTYRDALRHPLVRGLWLASVLSSVGDFVATGAFLVYAYDQLESVIGSGLVLAMASLPALLASALTGSFLDRAPRGPTLVTLQLAGAVIVAIPMLVDGVGAVFVAAALLGAVRTANVSIRSAAMAESLTEDLRGRLLAMSGTTEQAAQVVGLAAGAGLVARLGLEAVLLVDAATFVLGAIILSTLTWARTAPRDRRPPLTAGLRDIAANPVLRLLAALVLVTSIVSALPETLASGIAQGDPAFDAWVPIALAAAPLGQAATMLVMGRVPHVGRPTVQLTQLAWLSLAFGIAALGRTAPWFALSNFLVGSGVAWTMGPQLTFLRVAPTERMAQITGTMIAMIIVIEGVTTPLIAWFAAATTIDTTYRAAGVLVLVAAVLGWLVLQRTPAAVDLDEEIVLGSRG